MRGERGGEVGCQALDGGVVDVCYEAGRGVEVGVWRGVVAREWFLDRGKGRGRYVGSEGVRSGRGGHRDGDSCEGTLECGDAEEGGCERGEVNAEVDAEAEEGIR